MERKNAAAAAVKAQRDAKKKEAKAKQDALSREERLQVIEAKTAIETAAAKARKEKEKQTRVARAAEKRKAFNKMQGRDAEPRTLRG